MTKLKYIKIERMKSRLKYENNFTSRLFSIFQKICSYIKTMPPMSSMLLCILVLINVFMILLGFENSINKNSELVIEHMVEIKNMTGDMYDKNKCYPVDVNSLIDPKIFTQPYGNSCGKRLDNNNVNTIELNNAKAYDNKLYIDMKTKLIPYGSFKEEGDDIVYVIHDLTEKMKQKVQGKIRRQYENIITDVKNKETTSNKHILRKDKNDNPLIFIGLNQMKK